MSDEKDNLAQELGQSVTRMYLFLRKVCGLLPIPIVLPDQPGMDSKEMNQAVARLARIIEDQPVDEEVQAYIYGAAINWLSASKVFSLFLGSRDDDTAEDEIKMLLIRSGDYCIDVVNLLTTPSEGKE
jgi:hypothetical protein